MLKSIFTSLITTLIVIVFVLVGLDSFVTKEAKNLDNKFEQISYETNDSTKLQFVNEENNSVVPISSV